MAVTTEIDVRYRDLDTLAHVNNAVIATYLEEGRVGYIDDVFESGLAEYGFVIAHLEIDFERRVEIVDDVEVTVEVPELGTSSVPMEYEITAGGETAATAQTTLVFLDAEQDGTAPIPEEIRERVEAHEGL